MKSEAQQRMKEGTKIKDQYKGKKPSDVWGSWSEKQRSHFLHDHVEEIVRQDKNVKPPISDYAVRDYNNLPEGIKQSLTAHIMMGQYKEGDVISHSSTMGVAKWFDENKTAHNSIKTPEQQKQLATRIAKELGKSEKDAHGIYNYLSGYFDTPWMYDIEGNMGYYNRNTNKSINTMNTQKEGGMYQEGTKMKEGDVISKVKTTTAKVIDELNKKYSFKELFKK